MLKEQMKKVFARSLGIRKNDRVLILYDGRKAGIARLFAKSLPGAEIFRMKLTGQHGREPEPKAAAKMKSSDVVIAATTYSLTHTAASRASKARIASMPGFEKKMLGALLVDYSSLRRNTLRLARLLEKGGKVKIITPSGTEAEFSIAGSRITPSYGIVERDHVINLPDGEVFLPPKSMNGVLVFDSYGSAIKKPTRLVIRNNRIVEFEKSRNGGYMKKILHRKEDRFVAELGIGTNSAARLIGNVLEDEKVLGTCHIAFGNNLGFGGSNRSSVHIDVIFNLPTIWLDSRMIMKHGKPLW